METAPTPANLIIDLTDLGDGPSGAKQGEGEETLAPPLIPEIVPINVENTRDSGVDPKTRGVTEGEVGDSDPPAPGSPEGSQPRTSTLLGTSPDPGEDGAKDRPRPPPEERAEGAPTNLTSMVNNHPDCDLQVRALEPAQGEAVYDPHLLPTVNDPLVCELQVRSPEAAQGKTMQTSPQPTTVHGQSS